MTGAMLMGASGELKWKEAVRHVLLTRSGNTKRCVTDLIDHMITESKNLLANFEVYVEGGQLEHPGRWYYALLGTGCWQTEHDINALSAVLMPLARTWPFSGHWRCCGYRQLGNHKIPHKEPP